MRENKVARVNQIIDKNDDFLSQHNLHVHKYRWKHKETS